MLFAINRRQFLKNTLLVTSLSGVAARITPAQLAGGFQFDPLRDLIEAPNDPQLWPEFQRQLADWRTAQRLGLRYSDALYRRADFAWTSTNFACCFLMLCDELIYDAKAGRYLTREFLEHQTREFGGYDSVVLWHAYPRIGLDDRNQFDFYRDMPGGWNGLRTLSDEFHRAGVKVFVDYNPWDTGTRRESRSDLEALADLVAAVDADGIFLDTMDRGAAGFRAQLDAARPGVALEGEIALPLNRIHDHHCSWAQWFSDSPVPGVLRNKWFERRHLQHQIKRWDFDHSAELQTAWMNGSGMMIWENVFGSWMGWSARDKSILRQMLPIQRRYANWFCGDEWTPLVPTLGKEVFASRWQRDGVRLWTLVNRSETAWTGPLLRIPATPDRVFDLMQGIEAGRQEDQSSPPNVPGEIVITGSIPPRGLACFVAGKMEALGSDFPAFLESQRKTTAEVNWDTRYLARPTRLRPVPLSRRWKEAPPDMVAIPGASPALQMVMRERECGFYESSPAGGPRLVDAYNFRTRRFERSVVLKPFAIDLTPVTNEQFATFCQEAPYQPRHRENFLKHWRDKAPPAGLENHPVVYVDLEDARAYAAWAGKRLPTEEEWQYAAQGPNGLKFPWGDDWDARRCNGGETGGTTPVRHFPEGRSPFGVWDLCGNVWEWTESERSDGRTRFSILKGGSFYSAKGSGWYMDGGPRPNAFAAKFLLMWPGLDRCATIGFRCAAELE